MIYSQKIINIHFQKMLAAYKILSQKYEICCTIIWSTRLYINVLLFIPFLNRKHSYLLKNIGK